MVETDNPSLSIRRQCELIGLSRSTLYYEPASESELNLQLMRLIDEQYLRTPFYGRPRMTAHLRRLGYEVNPKRVGRRLQIMGLEAIRPVRRTSTADHGHKKYPYLLRGLKVTRPNQVWSADITYVPMSAGFMYLMAIIDWYSRYVVAWELSNTLSGEFCLTAVERALSESQPEIFNTDQGVQFTCERFTSRLEAEGIQISMDGRGRAFDNIFVERLWRSVKYEEIYIKEHDTVLALDTGVSNYFSFYNVERPHQSLGYRTPAEVHFQ
jgi:putative transposase